jgi:hypothetical protein
MLPFPGLAVPLLARALVVARTDTCPCGEVGGTHEHAHIDADLGDDGGRDQPVDTRDLHQQGKLGVIRQQLLSKPGVLLVEVGFARLDAIELLGHQEAVMLFHASLERRLQLGQLVPQPAASKLRDLCRPHFARSACSISRPDTPNT